MTHLETTGIVSNLKPVRQTKQNLVNNDKNNDEKLSSDDLTQYLDG